MWIKWRGATCVSWVPCVIDGRLLDTTQPLPDTVSLSSPIHPTIICYKTRTNIKQEMTFLMITSTGKVY